MKKVLLITLVALFSFNNGQAQLADGSVAPDFTLTDLNGTTHNLYSLLDDGYTVFIDFSAVWCSPCWSYHQTHALENLYVDHGPAGYPGVNSSTSDDVMVFYIEADGNDVASLGGSGGNTQGDWITGTSYPIICTDGTVNNNTVSGEYSISYYPTIYMICPDRLTKEVGGLSSPYSSIAQCPPPPSSDNDARTFAYSGPTLTCGDITPEVMIQNYGLVALTSATIDVAVNGSAVSSTPWTGNLATYATQNITLPVISGLSNNDAVSITVSLPNGVADSDPSNNPTVSFNVSMVQTTNVHVDVTVQIVTDAYGSETTWDIKDPSGMTVLSGGPYNNLSAAGTTIQTPVTTTLNTNECYFFNIYDSYGDGIDAGYGAGSFTVTDGNGTIISTGGQFTDQDGEAFQTGNGTGGGTAVNDINKNLSIYPNPVKGALTIEGAYTSIDIFDIFGKLVLSSEYARNINVSSLADGVYMLNITTEKGIQNQKITIAK